MKKNRQLLSEAINNIPDRYISEAAEGPKGVRSRKGFVAALAAALAVMLILPTIVLIARTSDPLRKYKNDPYYAVISAIARGDEESAYLKKLTRRSVWENLFDFFLAKSGDAAMPEAGGGNFATGDMLNSAAKEDEITDNQVEGVLEADIVKRNDEHAFYLRGNTFYIYTLDGVDSKLVATYTMNAYLDGVSLRNFYLVDSQLIFEGIDYWGKYGFTKLASFSVEDLVDGKIDETPKTATLQGSLISTRYTNGSLLVICGYYCYEDERDFESGNYLPHYEQNGELVAIAPEDITTPDGPSESYYTAVYLLDGEELSVLDSHALLGTPKAQYVSENAVYLVSESTALYRDGEDAKVFAYEPDPEKSCVITRVVSHIDAISYGEDGFTSLGSITLDGEVKDQYSMDEHNGILRVAVSTREVNYVLNGFGNRSSGNRSVLNASLYLVSLDTFRVISSANKFAPSGETVQSARFDDDIAYICTAEVVTFTDPVYRFDLSDPERISSMDTGTIDGYSTSLVELENGDLLGIGYGNDRFTLKLEIYRQGENSLVSVDSIELNDCEFPTNYKCYYIDREAGLFGIPIYLYSTEENGVTYYESAMHYILFSYDQEQLTVAKDVKISETYGLETVRGFVYNDDLYILSNNGLKVSALDATNG